MASQSWLDRIDWSHRASEFAELREYDDGRPIVVAQYEATGDAWDRLRELWLELEPNPHLLDALDRDGSKLLLRYAALYWKHPAIRLQVNRRAREIIAEWGVQIASVYAAIVRCMPPPDVAQFLEPVVHIDVGGAARVRFMPVASTLPADEAAIVPVIGQALRGLCIGLDSDDAARLRTILDRCTDTNADRFTSIDECATALRAAGGNAAVRAGENLASWTLAEEGLGWLAVRRRASHALDLLEGALELDPHLRAAEHGMGRAYELLGIVRGTVTATTITEPRSSSGAGTGKIDVHHRWNAAFDDALRRESQRTRAAARCWRFTDLSRRETHSIARAR